MNKGIVYLAIKLYFFWLARTATAPFWRGKYCFIPPKEFVPLCPDF